MYTHEALKVYTDEALKLKTSALKSTLTNLPLIPDMKVHILLTVLHTFLMELIRTIPFSFSLFIHSFCVTMPSPNA